jgi:hypothetical protein
MSTKETQEKIVANMKKWQKIEKASIVSTGKIMESTENPIIGLVAEIVQRDSQMHKRVQELIQDSLESKSIALSPDELGAVWNLVEKHIEIERDTIKLAKESLDTIGKNKGMTVQAYLLEYLLLDEEKHDAILSKLESIKKNMYPYG